MKVQARRALGALIAIALAFVAFAVPLAAQQAGDVQQQASGIDDSVPPSSPGAGKVLILDSTVSDGINSTESLAAQALGLGVDVVIDATWAGMTTGQFASYQAIIIGDPPCSDDSAWAAASANTAVWAPAVNGNVITNGTDPVFHAPSFPGALELTQKSVAFAAAQPGKTGFYASLSCWGPASGTPVDILNAVSPGWTAGPAGCGDSIAVVASAAILSGLTNEDLEGWGCSVHNFFETWPADFVVIAIDTDASPLYTAPDGTTGAPYILGRGFGLIAGNINLVPPSGTADVGSSYVMTAFVQFAGHAAGRCNGDAHVHRRPERRALDDGGRRRRGQRLVHADLSSAGHRHVRRFIRQPERGDGDLARGDGRVGRHAGRDHPTPVHRLTTTSATARRNGPAHSPGRCADWVGCVARAHDLVRDPGGGIGCPRTCDHP